MFFDIGSLEFLLLLVLAILVFGPEKLPKMIQDAAQFLRRIREFSDSAKRDIRAELGPEFKDFEFEDLNPKRFAKKHLLDGDDLGLKELGRELDVRKELTEVADAVNGRPSRRSGTNGSANGRGDRLRKPGDQAAASASGGQVSLAKNDGPAAAPRDDIPPFDADAT
ncbi:sec-independent translocase [Streptomyces sp. 7-21]|uniref:sec-independent translocase n=1 Tax=Streptomyces sp. 7-21 TaxID=2802283 RepID=UPI00191CA86D|nr:sec-independent translocase [Streptomyces sp. 7-21]MBL1066292.1 Sec-independent protein translocase subunit TatB [Streptomyces sp. 7-21]